MSEQMEKITDLLSTHQRELWEHQAQTLLKKEIEKGTCIEKRIGLTSYFSMATLDIGRTKM